jgi:hypothetical protein
MSRTKRINFDNVKFFGNFDRRLPSLNPELGERFLIVRSTDEGLIYGRYATLRDIWSNPNTGTPMYDFEYEEEVYGPDNAFNTPHAWAHTISGTNSIYELWTHNERPTIRAAKSAQKTK